VQPSVQIKKGIDFPERQGFRSAVSVGSNDGDTRHHVSSSRALRALQDRLDPGSRYAGCTAVAISVHTPPFSRAHSLS
jgi:hypothetical protein